MSAAGRGQALRPSRSLQQVLGRTFEKLSSRTLFTDSQQAGAKQSEIVSFLGAPRSRSQQQDNSGEQPASLWWAVAGAGLVGVGSTVLTLRDLSEEFRVAQPEASRFEAVSSVVRSRAVVLHSATDEFTKRCAVGFRKRARLSCVLRVIRYTKPVLGLIAINLAIFGAWCAIS